MKTIDPMVKARCGLFGVMKNIEYLMEHDVESQKIMGNTNISIQFHIKNGAKAHLSFANGKAVFKEGKFKSNISLYFFSAQQFNKMMDGKANPFLLKGFSKLKFLTNDFKRLTDRLEYYLKPSDKQLQEPDFFKKNTEMTAYTAFFSLCQIANYDLKKRYMAKRIPNGNILITIQNSIAIVLQVQDGWLTGEKKSINNPRATLAFDSIETAHLLLNDGIDAFTALGLGKMKMTGFVPMIENLNPFLDKVAEYLL